MKLRPKKVRLPKIIRARKKNIGELSNTTEDRMERHFFRRLANLAKVKRFVASWLLLMALILLVGFFQFSFLRDKYQQNQFVPGGTFNEGIVGTFTNANPIYASSSADSSVSKLVFAGLFTYDSQQKLKPDLAEKLEIDTSEKVYTVTLRENLRWQDGQPLTADDVAFTFNTIQKPEVKSYLLSSWQGIKVEAKNARTVVFTLPGNLSSFPNSLTIGILPKHLLSNAAPDQLRSNDFNTIKPVGSGPFKYDKVEVSKNEKTGQRREQIGLVANDNYHREKAGIKRFVIHTYNNQQELAEAYDSKKIDAMAGFTGNIQRYERDRRSIVYSVPLSGQTLVFFKTSQGVLSDSVVRKALVLGADRQKIIADSGGALRVSDEPLLKSQLGYDKNYVQKTKNIEGARKLLDDNGWKADSPGAIRKKDNNELKIKLYALSNEEYRRVAEDLQEQWRNIGVNVGVELQNDDDLKGTVSAHNYDALLTTISIGADPDIFAFWHSSQIDIRSKSRLNFSEYKSQVADSALEAGRSRSDPTVRAQKYKTFLEAWSQDNPALALYQPNYTFIVRPPFDGFRHERLPSPIDRYNDVNAWFIRQERR